MHIEHVFLSYFPQFDRLEGVLDAWPKLFATPPAPTQPLHVEGGTVYVLCHVAEWCVFIENEHDALVAGLRDHIDPDLGLDIQRVEPVSTTATTIYLARQIIVILARLRDLGAEF